MTHPVQTSSLFNKSRLYSNRYYCGNLYQVVVNTEDGESYEYEVEADTFADATKQAETEAALQELYSKIQQAAQDNQQAFNKAQQEKLGPILEKVRAAIAAVAKASGYVYIMEVGSVLYINEALSKDVTADVKAQLAKMK